MNSTEFNVSGKKIKIYGTNKQIDEEKVIIENLELTGNEGKDRLIIQNCIDKYKLKSDILYDGNTVYPFEKIIKSYRKLQNSDSLDNLTKEMYNFFIYACGDIAHYNIEGFKSYYDYSFRKLERELLSYHNNIPSWETDVDRIFKKLKIGSYYEEREFININNISLNKLKSIINECGWNVADYNDFWNIELKSEENFSFQIDVSSKKASNIIASIQNYYVSFNKEEYIEKMINDRKDSSDVMPVREIVEFVDRTANKLFKLCDDVLYKSRIIASDIEDMLEKEQQETEDYFETV